MDPVTLDLTVDQFFLPPQELILRHRHGSPTPEFQRYFPGAELRQQISEALKHRIVNGRLRIEFGELTVNLSLGNFYEHEGDLCRLIFLTRGQGEDRKDGALPPELPLLQLGGWVATHAYVNAPNALRLYHHVLRGKGPDATLRESWYRKFPLASEVEAVALATEQMRRIYEGLTKPDEALPECTWQDRHPIQLGHRKCGLDCPAAAHCAQFARYCEEGAELNRRNEEALSQIDPGA